MNIVDQAKASECGKHDTCRYDHACPFYVEFCARWEGTEPPARWQPTRLPHQTEKETS